MYGIDADFGCKITFYTVMLRALSDF